MTAKEIASEIVSNLNKLSNPKLPRDEFNVLADKIMESVTLSKMNADMTENDLLFLASLRLHCINSIDLLRGFRIQGKFNRMVTSKLKETGRDVTTLDDYLNSNVRPYFPNHDP